MKGRHARDGRVVLLLGWWSGCCLERKRKARQHVARYIGHPKELYSPCFLVALACDGRSDGSRPKRTQVRARVTAGVGDGVKRQSEQIQNRSGGGGDGCSNRTLSDQRKDTMGGKTGRQETKPSVNLPHSLTPPVRQMRPSRSTTAIFKKN